MMRKIGRIIECLAAGFLLGKGSVHIAYLKLNGFYDNDSSRITGKAVLNIIFINKNYEILDYLDVTDVTTLMIPITFLMLGLIIVADYLRIPQGFFEFLAARTDNITRLQKLVYRNTVQYIVLYVLSYVSAIGICSGTFFDLSVLSMIVVYALALILISRLCLIFYMNSSGAAAIVCAMVVALLLYLTDIYIRPAHLVLYDPANNQLYDIATLILGVTVTNIADQILVMGRSIYVT